MNQTSPNRWEGGGYVIVREVAGFGMEVFKCFSPGKKETDFHPVKTLNEAQAWCRIHALTTPVPEMDFSTHAEMQR